MPRDPIRDTHAPLPGEQRGKHASMEMEDRGAGRRPGALVEADDERPARLPGRTGVASGSTLPVPLDETASAGTRQRQRHDARHDAALADTFPASDPVTPFVAAKAPE
jgi:hypothetical protein